MLNPNGKSRLESVQQIQLNEHVVAATPKTIKVDHSFWPKLALLALAVLMIEWWFYHRRPEGASG